MSRIGLRLRHRTTFVVVCLLMVAVGVAVAVLTYRDEPAHRAKAVVILDGDQVDWPNHDAVLRELALAVASPGLQAAVARAADLESEQLRLALHVPRNQSITELTAEAPADRSALVAAQAAVDLLIEQNRDGRVQPAKADLHLAQQAAERATDNVALAHAALLADPASAERRTEVSVAEAELAAKIDALERARSRSDHVDSQILQIEPAELDSRPRRALARGIGAAASAAVLSSAALGLIGSRSRRDPVPTT